MTEKKPATIWTSGRRKTAIARIRLNKGKGTFIVNDKALSEYFPSPLEQEAIFSPFHTASRNPKGFDISIKVAGGGKTGQLEATILGLAKALVSLGPKLRPTFKKKSLLRRDPRMKERKKYGLKRARKAPQYSKR